jgi:hypothetical protein
MLAEKVALTILEMVMLEMVMLEMVMLEVPLGWRFRVTRKHAPFVQRASSSAATLSWV